MNGLAVAPRTRSWWATVTGFALILAGLPISYGGSILLGLGGSAYYLLAGIALIASGSLLILQRRLGVWLYGALYAATWIWAIAEAGLSFWPLAPRVVAPTVLVVPVLLSLAFLVRDRGSGRISKSNAGTAHSADLAPHPGRRSSWIGYGGAALAGLMLVAFAIGATFKHDAVYGSSAPSSSVSGSEVQDWTAYGRTNAGRRFAPFAKIDKSNVAQLQVAWTARSGSVPNATGTNEATPLQIGDKLVTCSPRNVVQAFDVDTGRTLWSYDPKAEGLRQRCRGVAYFEVPDANGRTFRDRPLSGRGAREDCKRRIVMTTIDSRLIELDLETGTTCTRFGIAGTVNLKEGLGDVPTQFYLQTSAPVVAGGLIVVGGGVADGANVKVPSGVIRAFDARTGKLAWVWDLGNPRNANERPGPNTVFTPGTPNVWAPVSIDEKLGLVYLPTGNPSPDHWGGSRTAAMRKYASSIVALDLATGRERWTFQTTHHDLWDYDVPSQPTLYDLPDGRGGLIPALIAPTKRGEIFVLDRRTGKPIRAVEERPAPRGPMADDPTAPTQPYSTGMARVTLPRLAEADMWGLSPLDQLWCRINFRKLRYDGDFTPPGLHRPSLIFPGTVGGFNWGSASIDETNGTVIVNDTRLGDMLMLASRADADREGKALQDRLPRRETSPLHGGMFPQTGTPYAAIRAKFMSPLNVPCQKPPYGTLSAISIKSGKLVWQVPMGTTTDTGPLGMSTGIPMSIGLPTLGGSVVTGSGLVFFAGTQDFYMRAIDASTGRELWKSRMPVGASATPMTYISPRTGRQFVVISAGGAADSPVKGDLIIAYALPIAK